MKYCEDYPCCGHTRLDPCSGNPVVMTMEEAQEAFYCDFCGFAHRGPCPDEYEEEDLDEPYEEEPDEEDPIEAAKQAYP